MRACVCVCCGNRSELLFFLTLKFLSVCVCLQTHQILHTNHLLPRTGVRGREALPVQGAIRGPVLLVSSRPGMAPEHEHPMQLSVCLLQACSLPFEHLAVRDDCSPLDFTFVCPTEITAFSGECLR